MLEYSVQGFALAMKRSTVMDGPGCSFSTESRWACRLVTRQPRGRELLAPGTFFQTLLTFSKGPTGRKLTSSSMCREEPSPWDPREARRALPKRMLPGGQQLCEHSPGGLCCRTEFSVSPLQFAQGPSDLGEGKRASCLPAQYLSCSILFCLTEEMRPDTAHMRESPFPEGGYEGPSAFSA